MIDAPATSTMIPAPLVAPAVAAPLAKVIVRSPVVIFFVSMIVVFPATYKLPVTYMFSLTISDPLMFTGPLTVNEFRIPTSVMFVCEAVCSVPVKLLALTLLAVKAPVNAALPARTFPFTTTSAAVNWLLATILAAIILPLLLSSVNVPTLVIRGCRAVCSVPIRLLALTPIALIAPSTVRPANVPREVMFGCDEVVSVPCT